MRNKIVPDLHKLPEEQRISLIAAAILSRPNQTIGALIDEDHTNGSKVGRYIDKIKSIVPSAIITKEPFNEIPGVYLVKFRYEVK